jgi:hypothetical protein
MRSTTLAILALGLTSTLPIGAAAAELVTIRTTGVVGGTDGLNLFGLGPTFDLEPFEIAYFFTQEAGTRQNFSFYNGNPVAAPPPPPDALFEVETHDRYLIGPLATPLPKVEFTIGGQTISFEANDGFSAEVIDYFRRGEPSDRVFNLAALASGGPSPYFSVELSQFLIQTGRFPAFGDAIAGPLPPTSITAPYFTLGSTSLAGDYGHFRAQRCVSIGANCQQTLLNFDFTSSIRITGVPEAPTWGMLLMGFGVTGYALRRRPKLAKARAQA